MPAQGRRRWYHAPGTLSGAAAFTAVMSWLTVAAVALVVALVHQLDVAPTAEKLFWLILLIVAAPTVGVAGLVTFWLAVAGAAATVPLAVLWFRDPHRSAAAGVWLLVVIASWAVLGVLLVWL